MLEAARRAAEQPAPTGEPADFDVETIAARIPGQKRAKSKASRGGFFTFEQSGTRPIQLVAVVALLAAGAGMLYGTLTDRPQPLPVRLDKPKATVGKVGSVRPKPDAESIVQRADAIGEPGAAAVSQVIEVDERRVVDMRAADSREAAISVLKPSADPETSPLYTSSSPAPAGRTGSGVTTGILIETGAPMPSIQDLRRYSEEQRMARISSQLGDKAVQVTERELASPASLTPDAVRPAVGPESAPSAAAVMSANAGGLPPALIGPMSLRVAAAKGDPSAEFEVASRFAQGKGVPKDFVKAAEWYQRAASRGSAPAQYRLGGLYERGIGVAVDPARARAWYRRAAELGNVKAMHNLAVMHTQRHGGEPDYASASQWFTKAAHHGLSDSQFNLAILHENGMGVARNPLEAYKWYALAAERGDSEAVKRRNAIAGKLSPADVERNRLAVAKWRPHATDPAANDPMMAGQAWRNRPSEDQMGGQGDGPTAPAANRAAARPVTTSGASPRQRPVQQEAEIIDLSSAAIDAQMKIDNAAAAKTAGAAQAETAAGPSAETSGEQQAIMNRKRKVTKVQSSADVEKMLTQFGYNPAALKKARPGGTSEEPSAASAREE